MQRFNEISEDSRRSSKGVWASFKRFNEAFRGCSRGTLGFQRAFKEISQRLHEIPEGLQEDFRPISRYFQKGFYTVFASFRECFQDLNLPRFQVISGGLQMDFRGGFKGFHGKGGFKRVFGVQWAFSGGFRKISGAFQETSERFWVCWKASEGFQAGFKRFYEAFKEDSIKFQGFQGAF